MVDDYSQLDAINNEEVIKMDIKIENVDWKELLERKDKL